MARKKKTPRIVRFYRQYLMDEDAARFIAAVGSCYTPATLCRLSHARDHVTRRAAVMALGFLSGYEANDVLGPALKDPDRGVRLIAETVIREVWKRDGGEYEQQQLGQIMAWNRSRRYEAARQLASSLIEQCPWFAEAWYQRAVALYHLRRFSAAADDCRQTLERNPYHFLAAITIGHCYLELGDPLVALHCFRRALSVHPDLELVRSHVRHLQRVLESQD
ncbi:MAG: trfA protein [Pirellulaceae bacterium]|nr:MAG: trfA protein [Pirellulaceae bacterium]